MPLEAKPTCLSLFLNATHNIHYKVWYHVSTWPFTETDTSIYTCFSLLCNWVIIPVCDPHWNGRRKKKKKSMNGWGKTWGPNLLDISKSPALLEAHCTSRCRSRWLQPSFPQMYWETKNSSLQNCRWPWVPNTCSRSNPSFCTWYCWIPCWFSYIPPQHWPHAVHQDDCTEDF